MLVSKNKFSRLDPNQSPLQPCFRSPLIPFIRILSVYNPPPLFFYHLHTLPLAPLSRQTLDSIPGHSTFYYALCNN